MNKALMALFAFFSILPFAHAEPEAGSSVQDMLKLRDPFKRTIRALVKSDVTDLEKYSIDQFRMLGMVTGPDRIKAALLAPDGKTHFVTERMKIGTRDGKITKITPNAVHVREHIVNVLGVEEPIETEIRFNNNRK
jgi:Tfp pilus assembly protein PilP